MGSTLELAQETSCFGSLFHRGEFSIAALSPDLCRVFVKRKVKLPAMLEVTGRGSVKLLHTTHIVDSCLISRSRGRTKVCMIRDDSRKPVSRNCLTCSEPESRVYSRAVLLPSGRDRYLAITCLTDIQLLKLYL